MTLPPQRPAVPRRQEINFDDIFARVVAEVEAARDALSVHLRAADRSESRSAWMAVVAAYEQHAKALARGTMLCDIAVRGFSDPAPWRTALALYETRLAFSLRQIPMCAAIAASYPETPSN